MNEWITSNFFFFFFLWKIRGYAAVLSDSNKKLLYDVGVYNCDDDDDDQNVSPFFLCICGLMRPSI